MVLEQQDANPASWLKATLVTLPHATPTYMSADNRNSVLQWEETNHILQDYCYSSVEVAAKIGNDLLWIVGR